jgi:phage terminase small subunit
MADETAKNLPVIDGGPYSKLTKRQRLFVDEYLASRTAAAAYLAAGYKGEDATACAWQLLKKPSIADAVIERRRQLLDDIGIRQERVVAELYAIATSDVRKLENELGETIPPHRLDAKTAASIASVEIEDVSIGGRVGKRYKYRFWDKTKALDKLGAWMKLWESGHAINIDNRKVEVHNSSSPDARSEATLLAINELIGQVRALGEAVSAPKAHPNGSLLPAPVRDEPKGHGTSVVDGEDQGSSEPT